MFSKLAPLCLAAAIDVNVDAASKHAVGGLREASGAAWDMHGAAAAGICNTGSDVTTFYIRQDGAVADVNTQSACEQACTDNLACDYYCFMENAVNPTTGTTGNNCLTYGGTCSVRTTSSGARLHTCYKKPASFYANINGHHLPADASNLNHLDISLTDRATCLGDLFTANAYIADRPNRVAQTMGRDCATAMRALGNAGRANNVNATDDAEECARYFEYKFRGDHRPDTGARPDPAETLVAEAHLCEYNSILDKCEAGHVHKVCPGSPAVVEVDEQ